MGCVWRAIDMVGADLLSETAGMVLQAIQQDVERPSAHGSNAAF